MFPHHECEIAQNVAWRGTKGVRYWVHNNMITINGQKMGKSLGNFITLPELFSGNHPKLDQAYSPMTVRFFILQAHYRGTLDFSNEALKAPEKGSRGFCRPDRDRHSHSHGVIQKKRRISLTASFLPLSHRTPALRTQRKSKR